MQAASSEKPVAAAPRGYFPVYLIHYQAGPNWIAGKPMTEQKLSDHAAYIQNLSDKGRVMAGGPLLADNGGLVILRVDSKQEAEAVLTADPAVLNGIFTGTVKEWLVVIDSGLSLRR